MHIPVENTQRTLKEHSVITQRLLFNKNMPEKLCLQWNVFQENIKVAYGNLREDKHFTDVTLACDDGKQLETHKVILAGSSPFFQKLLERNKHPHPLLYMRGWKSDDLFAIVDFLYCGEANVYQENLNSFLAIAEELQLKGLMEKFDENVDNTIDDEKPESQVTNPISKTSMINVAEIRRTNFPKECVKCKKVFNDIINWRKHIRQHPNPKKQSSIAGMIRLPKRDSEGLLRCYDCNKKVNCNSNFRRHVQKHHLKIDFKCDQCDFQHRDAPVISRHRKKHRVDVTC